MSEKKHSAGAPEGAEAPPEVPARWSARRKSDVVMRLLRGEPVDVVAREKTQVPAHELEAWRRVFLATGTQGLKKQGDPEARDVRRLQAKLGEVMMRLCSAPGFLDRRWPKQGHRLSKKPGALHLRRIEEATGVRRETARRLSEDGRRPGAWAWRPATGLARQNRPPRRWCPPTPPRSPRRAARRARARASRIER